MVPLNNLLYIVQKKLVYGPPRNSSAVSFPSQWHDRPKQATIYLTPPTNPLLHSDLPTVPLL